MAAPKKVSVKSAVAEAKKAERDATAAPKSTRKTKDAKTKDSYQNYQMNLGQGTANALAQSTYGFNPVTRNRTLMEWIHRGSWIGGIAIDAIAEDMTKNGVEFAGSLDPEDAAKLKTAATMTNVWESIKDTIRWARLYGGAVGVMLIDGQDMSTPLRIETIGKGQFKGMFVLDRWMCEPSLEDLVTDFGPHLGLPKFYRVEALAPALRMQTIHYTRVIRMEGVRLPYWQRVMENLWGASELERIYDRLIAFDSTTTGAAQSVHRAYLRTIKIDGLREVIAAGGATFTNLQNWVTQMAVWQSTEGVTILDGADTFEGHSNTSFTGMSDLLIQFGQQISGGLKIPMVRLFGQSPAGLNSTGESDLRTYYDGILQEQEKYRVEVNTVYRALAMGEGIKLPDDFNFEFVSLWKPTEQEKATIAQAKTQAILAADEAGLLTQQTTLKELREIGHETGVFTHITDAQIEAADDKLPDPMEQEEMLGPPPVPGVKPVEPNPLKKELEGGQREAA